MVLLRFPWNRLASTAQSRILSIPRRDDFAKKKHSARVIASMKNYKDPVRIDFLTGREYFVNFSVDLSSWLAGAGEPFRATEEERFCALLSSDEIFSSENVLKCVSQYEHVLAGCPDRRITALILAKLWNDFQRHSHYYAFDSQLSFKFSVTKDPRFRVILSAFSEETIKQLTHEQVVILALYLRWMGVGFEEESVWRSIDEGKLRCADLAAKDLMRLLVAGGDRAGMLRLGTSLTAVKDALQQASTVEDMDCLSTCVRFAHDFLTSEVRHLYSQKVSSLADAGAFSASQGAVVLVKIATVFTEFRRDFKQVYLDAARKILDACIGRCWELRPLDIAKLAAVVRVFGGEPRKLKKELERSAESLLDEIWDNICLPGLDVDIAAVSGPASDLLSVLPPELIDTKFNSLCEVLLSSICDLLVREGGAPYFVKTVIWLKHWHPLPGSEGEKLVSRFFTLAAALQACEPSWMDLPTLMKNGAKFSRFRDPFGDGQRHSYVDFERALSYATCEAIARFSYSPAHLSSLGSIALLASISGRPIPYDAFETLLSMLPQCTIGDLVRLSGASKDVYRFRGNSSPATRRQASTLRRALAFEVKRRACDNAAFGSALEPLSLLRLLITAEGLRPNLSPAVWSIGRALKTKNFLDRSHSGMIRDLAKALTSARIADEGYLRALQDQCVAQQKRVSEEAVFAVLEASFSLGFCDLPVDFGELCEQMITEQLDSELPNLGLVLPAIYCLSACGSASHPLIQRVFDPEMLHLLRSSKVGGSDENVPADKLRAALVALNRVACLDYPELFVEWLPLSSALAERCETQGPRGSTHIGELGEALRLMFGSENVQYYPKLYYGIRPSFTVDKSGSSVAVLCVPWAGHSCEAVSGPMTEASWALADPVRLNGRTQTRIRHLELLGFKVAVVKELEWQRAREEGSDAVKKLIVDLLS